MSSNQGNEDSQNSLIDIISLRFMKSKDLITKELDEHLEYSDTTDEYHKEIFENFKTKAKVIFDIKTGSKTFLDFVTNVYGKSNIALFHVIKFEDDKETLINKQLIFLKGTLNLFQRQFEFSKNDLFTYGNYYQMNQEEYEFVSFRAQDSSVYVKVEDNAGYGIFDAHGSSRTIFKFPTDFFQNLTFELIENTIEIEDFIEENGKEQVAQLFATYPSKKAYVEDFVIYQIDS